MELSPKNPSEQCSFQEKKREIFKDLGSSSVGKDVIVGGANFVTNHDLTSSLASTSHIQEEIFDREKEVVLLKQKLGSRPATELSSSESNVILRGQFGEIIERGNSSPQSGNTYYKNMEILRKLPPDTVVIRREAKASKEDSDYRELMETNSSGSSSTSGCIAKAKRFTRARNKTRETVEVRRNPMRVSKKNFNKDFFRSKQRLLVNRREICANYESGKRNKSATTPYMKTRSVTRKMYTVGATYQAPTKKDEMEWKEWPVHGMHERPVYHPQVGLSVEYLGRYFTSLDGLSYCEIIDKPEIEVVAVDPYRDRRTTSVEKKSKGQTKKKSISSDVKEACNSYFAQGKSFETCMHGSLHCVLGYCSQIMTPAYKQATKENIKPTAVPACRTSSSETSAKEPANVTSSSKNVSSKFAETAKLIEAIAKAQRKRIMNSNANGQRTAAIYPSSSTTYIPESQRSIAESDSSKIPRSGEMVRMNLQRILQDTSNNSLILLRNSAAKTSGEDCTAIAKDVFSPAKLEDGPINDKTLTNPPVYKKLVLAGESPVKNNLYALKRYPANTRSSSDAKKRDSPFLGNQLENVHAAKENHKSRNADKIKINRESNNEMMMMSFGKDSETSEIARILSEYNNSTLRKPTKHSQTYDSKRMKANVTNLNAKALPENFWQKNMTVEKNQNFKISDMNAELLQEKWKRYNLTTGGKIRDNEIASSTQSARNSLMSLENNSLMSLENNQGLFTDRQMSLNTLKHVRELKGSYKERDIVMTEAKSQEGKSGHSKDENEVPTEPLQEPWELLENTAILYCAANGVHQDDLSNYIDTLDSKQSIQWLESWNNSAL